MEKASPSRFERCGPVFAFPRLVRARGTKGIWRRASLLGLHLTLVSCVGAGPPDVLGKRQQGEATNVGAVMLFVEDSGVNESASCERGQTMCRLWQQVNTTYRSENVSARLFGGMGSHRPAPAAEDLACNTLSSDERLLRALLKESCQSARALNAKGLSPIRLIFGGYGSGAAIAMGAVDHLAYVLHKRRENDYDKGQLSELQIHEDELRELTQGCVEAQSELHALMLLDRTDPGALTLDGRGAKKYSVEVPHKDIIAVYVSRPLKSRGGDELPVTRVTRTRRFALGEGSWIQVDPSLSHEAMARDEQSFRRLRRELMRTNTDLLKYSEEDYLSNEALGFTSREDWVLHEMGVSLRRRRISSGALTGGDVGQMVGCSDQAALARERDHWSSFVGSDRYPTLLEDANYGQGGFQTWSEFFEWISLHPTLPIPLYRVVWSARSNGSVYTPSFRRRSLYALRWLLSKQSDVPLGLRNFANIVYEVQWNPVREIWSNTWAQPGDWERLGLSDVKEDPTHEPANALESPVGFGEVQMMRLGMLWTMFALNEIYAATDASGARASDPERGARARRVNENIRHCIVDGLVRVEDYFRNCFLAGKLCQVDPEVRPPRLPAAKLSPIEEHIPVWSDAGVRAQVQVEGFDAASHPFVWDYLRVHPDRLEADLLSGAEPYWLAAPPDLRIPRGIQVQTGAR